MDFELSPDVLPKYEEIVFAKGSFTFEMLVFLSRPLVILLLKIFPAAFKEKLVIASFTLFARPCKISVLWSKPLYLVDLR